MNSPPNESNESADTPVCLVTGGTSGIGLATSRLFARSGYRIGTCGRDAERLSAVEAELGSEHWVSSVDLEHTDQATLFARSAIERFGRIDVLVNNAAVAPLTPFAEIEAESFETTLNVNVRSPFYLTQLIWRKMVEQGSGVVVNISSLAAIDPFPGFSIYGASKAWLDLTTTALKTEGQDHGIRIYSIRAGAVETPLLRRTFPDFPAEQCVSPEDIAATIMACVNNEHESGSHVVVANQA